MKPILLAAAFTAFTLGVAQADCSYHKSVSAGTVDKTTVASIAAEQTPPVVAPEADAAAPPTVGEGQ